MSRLLMSICMLLTFPQGRGAAPEPVSVVIDPGASPRLKYGADRLVDSLKTLGVQPALVNYPGQTRGRRIVVGTVRQECVRKLVESGQLKLEGGGPGREGFLLAAGRGSTVVVAGGDDSGALYGCLELARRIRLERKLPSGLRFADAPKFVLRGACIGMQKTYILPGRRVYEYPYTQELFPFFYDKAFWKEYLDFLVDKRMNTLYLWNGHPFASLVKLKDFPYALEVSEEDFRKNVEMYRYIAGEADRRGIWLVQMFYSIIVSKPFAEHNGLRTQLASPTPIVSDYMRKSIAEFIRQYPNVGLLVCLGEALRGLENQVQWTTQTILPGVHDGMKMAGIKEEPPVIIRAHATDPDVVLPAALKVYRNLFTMAKYNGESLTTWEPRGTRQQVHLAMSRLGSTHVVNVHILANLEPFRYGAQQFIKRCVQASRDRLGARGVHLYPLSYWNWPDSPDMTDAPLRQYDRDWIWFESWARYSWNPDVPDGEDRAYWVARLSEIYGSREAGEKILDAYNFSGECAPRILRRFGITEGNRQTMSLGMTLDELVHPEKYSPFPELWESQSPPGERLQEFVQKEWNKEPHEGETPPQIIREVLEFSQKAVASIEAASPLVARNRDEFARLRNDIHCIRAMSEFYAAKAQSAIHVLLYSRSQNVRDMEQALDYLGKSFESYQRLAGLTEKTYRFANSMQTSQRRIPVVGGVNGQAANYHWTQLLPLYKKELDDFRARVEQLRRPGDAQ